MTEDEAMAMIVRGFVEPIPREIGARDVHARLAKPRRRRRQPEWLPAEVVGGDQQNPHGFSLFHDILPAADGWSLGRACLLSAGRASRG